MDSVLSKIYENRFIPARGAAPVCLEGRKEVCNRLHIYIRATIDGSPPKVIPVILGPIGIGKTAILRWIESHAKDEIVPGESLKVTFVSGSTLQSPEDARKLFGGDVDGEIWKQTWSDIEDKSKVDLLAERRKWEKGQFAPNTSKAIDRHYQKATNIIIVDDAQLIKIDALISLTNEVEWLRRTEGVAILLILGGRQGLLDLIRDVNSRSRDFNLSTDVIRLRPLKFLEVCKVVRSTLALGEIPIGDQALLDVSNATGGHPFFVQLWGNILWNETRWHHKDCVTEEDVGNAKRIFDHQLGKTEGFRRRDWNKDELTMIEEVGKALREKDVLSQQELDEVVVNAGESVGLDDFQSREILGYMLREDIIDRDSLDGGYKEAIPMRIEYFVANGTASIPAQG